MDDAVNPARGKQLRAGDRFGELVVERFHGRSRRGNVWALRCDCGRAALRRYAVLVAAVRSGKRPCCERCRDELWGGICHERRQRRRKLRVEAYRRLWDECGSLYGPNFDERERRAIVAELAAMGMPQPAEDPPSYAELCRGADAARNWRDPAARPGLAKVEKDDGAGLDYAPDLVPQILLAMAHGRPLYAITHGGYRRVIPTRTAIGIKLRWAGGDD